MPAVPPVPVTAAPPAAAVPDLTPTNTQDGDFTAFDFVVGGNNYGQVYGHFGASWFEPSEAKDVIALLPSVKNPEDFLPLFQGRIDPVKTIRGVGTAHIDTSNFKLILDIDPAETILAAVGGIGELRGSENNFALRNDMFAAGSADTNSLDLFHGASLTHDTVLSKGSMSLESSGTVTATNGYVLRTAQARKDFSGLGQDLTAYGGLLETASGMHFAKSVDYTGLRFASNQDLLFRDQQLQGSNIQLFLQKRELVEIYRGRESEGQVLYSRVMDFGTVQIDTRAFPQGSYDIEIVIRDGGTVVSRETRPFIKTQNLPPRGKPLVSFEMGEIRQDTRNEGVPVAAASYRMRLNDWLGGGVGVEATQDDRVYELSLSSQKNAHLFGAMGLVEASLTGAFADSLKPAGFDASVSWTNPLFSASLAASKAYARPDAAGLTGSLALTDRQAVDLNLSAPFTFRKYKFYTGFTGEISQSDAAGRAYHYGPTLTYTFEKYREYTPDLRLEYTASNTDNRILATLTFRNADPVWTKSLETDLTRTGSNDTLSTILGMGYTGKGTEYDDWRRKIDANLGLRLDPLYASDAPRAQTVSGDVQYTGKFVRAKTFVDQNLTTQTGQMGGEMESTLVWSPGNGIKATSMNASANMAIAMITLRGADTSKVDITVDGATKAVAHSGDTVVLSIPAYQKVKVAAVDKQGKGSMKIREEPQVIIGYPGNVAYREFNIVKSWVLTGTLLDDQKKPLQNTRFTLGHNIYYTDDSGFFTMEEAVGAGEKLDIAGDGFACPASLPATVADGDAMLDLGSLICAKKPRP